MDSELERCIHCGAYINPEFGADSPATHADAEGTEDDPRSPGDYDNVCDVCKLCKRVARPCAERVRH